MEASFGALRAIGHQDLETSTGCCVKLSPSGSFYPGSSMASLGRV